MSTSTSTVPATTTAASPLTLSDFARQMSERHYLFLSQSQNDLQRLVDRHHAERQFIFNRLLEAGLVEPRIKHHTRSPIAESIVTNERREELIETNGQQMTRRYRYRYHPYSSSRRIPSPLSNIRIRGRRQSLNHHNTTNAELGTKENPINVQDVDAVRCEGCGEDGHVIWDCTKEYSYDGDPSHSPVQDFKQKVRSPQPFRQYTELYDGQHLDDHHQQ
jgi:hypothetical protein